MKFKANKKGVSLFEVVVVVGIFALVAILTTRSTFLTLKGSRKSDSQIKVKENLEYALSIIERQLRNSESISSSLACDGATSLNQIDYSDSAGKVAYFSCKDEGQTSGYIASGSAQPVIEYRLTTPDISITSCEFICLQKESGVPTEVTINLSAKEVNSPDVESSNVTTSAKVLLRNY